MPTEKGASEDSVMVEGVHLDPPHLDTALDKLRLYRDGVASVKLTLAESQAILLALRRLPEDRAEYSPGSQDEYRRLWHEATAERDRLKAALELIVGYSCIGTPWNAYVDLKRIAREALDATD